MVDWKLTALEAGLKDKIKKVMQNEIKDSLAKELQGKMESSNKKLEDKLRSNKNDFYQENARVKETSKTRNRHLQK